MPIKRRNYILFALLVMLLLPAGYMKYNGLNLNELGLQVLTWVKKVKGQSVDLSTLRRAHTATIEHDLWTDILKRYVDNNGNVDYDGLVNNQDQFIEYLKLLSDNPPGLNWSEEDELAYWINVYNAFTVQLILDNYPLKSIKDIRDGLPMIDSPWDIKFFNIGGVDMDLNTVEHEILRKQFNEPRIHFAINCASISCPRLRDEAFIPSQLEMQLEDQARVFLNEPSRNLITVTTTELSQIFDWFRSDFTTEGKLTDYVRKYNSNLNPQNDIQYLEYDWSLNISR